MDELYRYPGGPLVLSGAWQLAYRAAAREFQMPARGKRGSAANKRRQMLALRCWRRANEICMAARAPGLTVVRELDVLRVIGN